VAGHGVACDDLSANGVGELVGELGLIRQQDLIDGGLGLG
jgi:hypothetical protein